MRRFIFIVMILIVIAPAFAEENSLQEQISRGFDYIKSGDYQKASYVFALVLEYDRDNADAYFGRGICFLNLGDNEIMTNSVMIQKAIHSFWKAQELGIQENEIYYFLGRCFLALNKKDVAVNEYNILESLDKELAKQLLARIVAYKPLEQYTKEEVIYYDLSGSRISEAEYMRMEAKRQQAIRAREAEMAVMQAEAREREAQRRAINDAVSAAINAERRARNAEIRASEAEMETEEAKRKARQPTYKYNPETGKTMFCPPGAAVCY